MGSYVYVDGPRSCLFDAPPEDVGVLPKEGDTKFRHGGIVVRRGTHNIMGI